MILMIIMLFGLATQFFKMENTSVTCCNWVQSIQHFEILVQDDVIRQHFLIINY
jgi:hypothetical protein